MATHARKTAHSQLQHFSCSEFNRITRHDDRKHQATHFMIRQSVPFDHVTCSSYFLASIHELLADVAEYIYIERERHESDEIHENL